MYLEQGFNKNNNSLIWNLDYNKGKPFFFKKRGNVHKERNFVLVTYKNYPCTTTIVLIYMKYE